MARTKKGKRLEADAQEQEYQVVPMAKLKEHPRNPRRGNEAAIDESIDVNGWYGACVVQRSTGFILAGNHRYRVAKKRGATRIPAILLAVDDQTALRILLADNKTADLGGYDEELLGYILEGLESLDGTGYAPALAEVAEQEENGGPPTADPNAGEVPDDQYTPQFAVIVVCESEEAQADVYADVLELDLPEGAEVRVTAV